MKESEMENFESISDDFRTVVSSGEVKGIIDILLKVDTISVNSQW